MSGEGVIQFQLEHTNAAIDAELSSIGALDEAFCQLVAWREILARTQLVGQHPARYEGFGYGNASVRVGRRSAGRGRRAFLITGTQTSGKDHLKLGDCALVRRYDTAGNRVVSSGRTRPSSEALSHAAVYDLGPHIQAVLHVHSPVLWSSAAALRIPTTDPAATYGTPAMAQAIAHCYAQGRFAERQILAMGGHEDGMVAFGRSIEEAGLVLVKWLGRAYKRRCSIPF